MTDNPDKFRVTCEPSHSSQRPTEEDLANILIFAEATGVDPSNVHLCGGPYSDWIGTYERPKRGRKVRVSSRQFGRPQ